MNVRGKCGRAPHRPQGPLEMNISVLLKRQEKRNSERTELISWNPLELHLRCVERTKCDELKNPFNSLITFYFYMFYYYLSRADLVFYFNLNWIAGCYGKCMLTCGEEWKGMTTEAERERQRLFVWHFVLLGKKVWLHWYEGLSFSTPTIKCYGGSSLSLLKHYLFPQTLSYLLGKRTLRGIEMSFHSSCTMCSWSWESL